jgi:outer membrane receptor protein involved in Fe transport
MLLAALILAQVSEAITVTATRTETRVADTPASVVVLSREELQRSAAPTLDDSLRQVAGFTLFRRNGSRVANPTTQGVSLRGIGASGGSRALVLDDGIPLNDPFGGWVYWGRVPRVAIERVEVLRGGASDLYGSSAMGGVIQFIRRRTPALSFETSGGSQDTGTASLFAASRNVSIATDWLTTAGYVLVRPEDRGAVDVPADSKHVALDATVRHEAGFLRASYYDESRSNGTPLQVNDTTIRQLAGGFDFGGLGVRAYASDQDYDQTFTAIADDRNSERLTVAQTVPSNGYGANAQWSGAITQKQVLVVGGEFRDVRGRSDELRGTVMSSTGGRQRTGALFAEDLIVITPALSVTAGLRADRWRDENELSPRLTALWRANDALALSASAYQAFRAPTLNELYRGFRVGNVNTLANPDLTSERMTGFELGARLRNARLTLFQMSMDDTIANVTISTTPSLITRQRQNLGETRSRGAELDGEWRFARDVRLAASWMFVDARVIGGKRIPQVPRHQATAQASWRDFGVAARWSSMQFDDDLNELRLRPYVVVDAFASHALPHGFAVTLSAENLFDREIEASATPVITLGQPRAFRLGLRYAR